MKKTKLKKSPFEILTVKKLIALLKKHPQDANIMYYEPNSLAYIEAPSLFFVTAAEDRKRAYEHEFTTWRRSGRNWEAVRQIAKAHTNECYRYCKPDDVLIVY